MLVPLVLLLGRPAALCQLPSRDPLHAVRLLPQGQEGHKELPGPPAQASGELNFSAVAAIMSRIGQQPLVIDYIVNIVDAEM